MQTLRALRRDWVFTLAAIAIMSVAIAANSSVFTLVNTILLKPLSYSDPERIVRLETSLPDIVPDDIPFSTPDVYKFRERSRAFSAMAAFISRELDLSGAIEPTRIPAARVEGELWQLIGAKPLMGRLFDPAEDRRGDRHLVISHALWKRLFSSDPNVIGRGIDVNRQAYTITAVMPPGFVFPPPGLDTGDSPAEAWVPISFTKDQLLAVADQFNNGVIAKLNPGVSATALDQELRRLATDIKATYPAELPLKRFAFHASPLIDQVVGDTRGLLLLLLACVGGVLLIGAANISSLMLARAVGRAEEFAVRKALGASTWQLLRQSFLESLFIAIPGSLIGLLLTAWSIDLLIRLAPASLPRMGEVTLDWRVTVFTLAISIGAAFLFALAPAWQASRTDPGSIRGGAKGGSQSRQSLRLGLALVSVEVALCFMLLGATGLLVATWRNILDTDPGFAPRKLLAFEVSPRSAVYGEGMDKRKIFFDRLDQSLATIPGIERIAWSDAAPLAIGWRRIFLREGQTTLAADVPQITVHSLISPGYFSTIGARLVAGREFYSTDRTGSQPVCIVSQTLARKFFPNGAIGQRIRFGGPGDNAPLNTIIGVVADIKVNELNEGPMVQTFEPILQHPANDRTYLLKATGDPSSLAAAARAAVRSIDPGQVVANVRTMNEVIDRKAARRKFQMLLLGVFASAALLLAFTGIFAVIANTIQRQTREIGIRMALGATSGTTLKLILYRALRPVLTGLALGFVGFLAAGRAIESFLFQVTPRDPLAISLAAGVLLLAAVLAIIVPARRAMRVNPAVSLRAD